MNLNGNDEEVVITIFPGGPGASSFNFYEDNGNDKNYALEYAVTKLTSSRQGQEQTVVISKREGQYKDMPVSRSFKVKVLSSLVPQSVTVNGQPVKFEYLGEEFALSVDLPVLSCNQEKIVKIVYPAKTANMNGLLGVSKRIAQSMEQLKYRDSYICFKEEFGKMGSLRESVTYAPGKIFSLVSEFWKSYGELPEVLQRQGLNDDNKTWFLQSICWNK